MNGVILEASQPIAVDFNPQKTEAILFTTQRNVRLPQLYFDNIPVNFVESHKHLGLTLGHDGKWHDHIYNVLKSASKVLGIMRSLKFKVSRKSLNTIYVTHLRPIIEYACVVWDGCSLYEKDLLDKIQHEAARIVYGLTRSVSLSNLYNEVKWPSLDKKRQYIKLINMYKIQNGHSPTYLANLPPTVQQQSSRSLRNGDDYVIVSRRKQLYSRSFLPSAIDLWNSLDINIRNSNTISHFKSNLKCVFFASEKIPQYFFTGNRKSSIFHARLRNNCSDLNSDLFQNHLTTSPVCSCGMEIENASHYFFKCSKYHIQRLLLFNALRSFHPLNSDILLHGKQSLNDEANGIIFTEL